MVSQPEDFLVGNGKITYALALDAAMILIVAG